MEPTTTLTVTVYGSTGVMLLEVTQDGEPMSPVVAMQVLYAAAEAHRPQAGSS